MDAAGLAWLVLGALFLLAWSTNWGTTFPFKPVGT